MATLSRRYNRKGTRVQVKIGESLEVKVEELERQVFFNEYEGGTCKSDAVRFAIRLAYEMMEKCDEDIELKDLPCSKRKHEFRRWCENFLEE